MQSHHSLSVVIPVFNGAGWIGRCIEHVDRSIARSGFGPAEIVVVDDGSSDGTVDEVTRTRTTTPTRLVRQTNQGRFVARRTGLTETSGEFVLFIDTRVFLGEESLRFVEGFVDRPETSAWTAHVELSTDGNNLGRFWRAIEHVAWRRYFRQPRRTSFGLEEFDYYPKGTTALFCPRGLIEAAYDAYVPTVSDPSKINDDTALLRYVVERVPLNIAPDYRCTYHARTTLKSFLKHANHRGAVLIDGYLRPGTRFAIPIALVLGATPVGIVATALFPVPVIVLAAGASVAAGVGVGVLGADKRDSAVLAALAVPFGVSYLAGMWKGFFLKLQQRRIDRPAAAPGASS